MSARSRDIITATLAGAGIVGAGELYFACQASTNAQGSYWKDWFDREKYFAGNGSPSSAHAAMTSLQNDVLLVASDALITCTASITWSNNECHMVGMFPAAWGQRSGRARIGASGNFTPLITVSGYGNMFNNIHFMHGQGSSANINLLVNTGARNIYKNCHFACYNATELDGDTYMMVSLGDCSEVYFGGCYFGNDSVAMSSGALLEFASNTTIRMVMDGCNFCMRADTAAPNFIHVKPGAGMGTSFIKNTLFINNNSSTALTTAIASSGLGAAAQKFIFDSACGFGNVTDIGAAADEAGMLFQGMQYGSGEADQHIHLGIMRSYDHTSG